MCLIVPLLPDYLPVQAEENTDAFGIKMDEEFNEEEAKKNNPYGTEDWMNLFTVAELFVGKGDSNSRSWRTYNYNKDGEEGSIGDPTSSVTSTGKSEGNKDGFSLLDSAACDFKGEGQKRYTATVGYWRNKNERYMQLFLTDASGNRISNTIKLGSKGSLNYLEGAEAHNNTGFISVAAGDFDGDGRDSILVYVPEMKKADDGNEKQPGIYEYTISTSGALTYKGLFSYVYGMLGVSNVSQNKGNDGKIRKNAPVVQMIAEDTD